MELYKRQQRDEKNKKPETGGNKAPIGEIRMISGGLVARGSSKSLKKAYATEVNSVHSRFSHLKVPRCSEPNIVFFEKDDRGIRQPHDNPLVIMLRMEEFNMHWVLVDNGSSIDIIYLSSFQQIKLNEERLRPFSSLLVCFTEDRVIPKGFVKITIIAGTYPAEVSKEIDFLVVDCPSTYNVILGRPTLNMLKAMTLTYYLKVKFPTTHGLALSATEKMKITNFLRENQNVFAWKHEDMPWINREIIQHHVNVNPECKPVQQRWRIFALECNKAVAEEIEKLLEAGFIREVFYPEWLVNVVTVKKNNSKCKMCVDFKDLNKACPKDSFLLPRID
nr:uncharacterized protein LOC111999933 [Quercus suber]